MNVFIRNKFQDHCRIPWTSLEVGKLRPAEAFFAAHRVVTRT